MIRDTVGDWQELSTLYERADSLDAAGLAAWLAELRVERHRLLPQLERMLEANEEATRVEFLSALPLIDARPSVLETDWDEGSRIGAYRLLRHIGSGGMAEVWLAERCDGAFERQVAIKLLFNHPARDQRETFVERFRRERDILASLSHPLIAPLHDAGVTPSGQPWLALEYVEGEGLAAWCDRHRLPVRKRIEVFRQVLLAVEHAHRNLVVHRDLKPSNILVTAGGQVRLLDFGIAKLADPAHGPIDETELTVRGGRPLTVAYASPEQLLGRPLTTACDVHSLGVILYELLCGVRPFDDGSATANELQRRVLEDEPRRLSRAPLAPADAELRGTTPPALRRALRGDLEAITAKAIERDLARRYPSVESLRADLDRFLEERPVAASTPGVVDRSLKFIRRHRLLVATAGLSTAAVLVAAGVAVAMAIEASGQRNRAVASRDYVLDMFTRADPNQAHGVDVSARDILAAGKARAATSFKSLPSLRGDVLSQIGVVEQRLGDLVGASETWASAAEAFREAGDTRSMISARIELADIQARIGDANVALAMLNDTGSLARAFPDDHALWARQDEVRGWALADSDQLAAAFAAMQSALGHARAAHGENHVQTVDMLRGLASIASERRDYRTAGEYLDGAEKAAAGLPELPANDIINLQLQRAKLQDVSGWPALAIDTAKKALIECDRLLGAKIENCFLLRHLLATAYLRTGAPAQAAEFLPALVEAANGARSPVRQAEALIIACRILRATERLAESPSLLSRLSDIAQGHGPRALPAYIVTAAILAVAEAAMFEGPPPAARDRVEAYLKDLPSSLEPLPLAQRDLESAIALQRLGAHDEALQRLRAADERLSHELGSAHSLITVYRLNQAASEEALGHRARAMAIFDAAIPVLREHFGPDAPLLASVVARRNHLRAGSAPPLSLGPSDVFLP
ncbi:MAG: serine/threonine-protein kinase [Caldimonas sp.]